MKRWGNNQVAAKDPKVFRFFEPEMGVIEKLVWVSTPGDAFGWRWAWPWSRWRGDWPGPDSDIMVVTHINPGRVWQESGKPGCKRLTHFALFRHIFAKMR